MDVVPTYSVKIRGVKQDVNKLHAYHPYFKAKVSKGATNLHTEVWFMVDL